MPKREPHFNQMMEYIRSISSIPMAFTSKSHPKTDAERNLGIASGEITIIERPSSQPLQPDGRSRRLLSHFPSHIIYPCKQSPAIRLRPRFWFATLAFVFICWERNLEQGLQKEHPL